MPRTRSIAWSELKLGVVGIVALVLVTTLVFAVGGQGGFPWQHYALKARFQDVNGLKPGAVVRLSGKDVGKVTNVDFVGTDIDVVFDVSRSVQSLVTSGSEASLGSLSLLGEPILDITASSQGAPLPQWSYVRSSSKSALADLTTSASQSLDEVGRLVADVRAGRGSVGKMFTDPALYNELEQFSASANVVAGYLKNGKGTLGKLTNDPAAYNQLTTALTNLREITQKIDNGEGPLARLLNDDAMGTSLKNTTANLDAITDRLSRGEGSAGKLLTDRQLYDQMASVTGRLDRLLSGLEAGQGTAGQLLKDRELYENMNGAVSQLRSLVAAILKDPKKYLNVHVSIF